MKPNTKAVAKLPPSAKAKIDGNLVYFNWADYMHPKVLQGFQDEYDVKIIQSNFDTYEGMVAKMGSGNKYDIVFPGAKWVESLRNQGKLRAIDHEQLTNADQVFYNGSVFNDPWYDPGSKASVPFTVYKTGIAWRTNKVDNMTGSWRDLWNEQAAGRSSPSTTSTRRSRWLPSCSGTTRRPPTRMNSTTSKTC